MLWRTAGFVAWLALAACSSNSSGGGADASADSSPGPGQPAGGSCDPSLEATACAASYDVCLAAVCSPTSRICVVEASDAGGCGQTNSCSTSSQCTGGVCVQGLCYQTCLTNTDCGDGGTCTTSCVEPPGCAEQEDACAQTCNAYCTVTF